MNPLTAARTDPQTARSYWTMGRRDSERAFRAARRHSRHVRFLRVALPVAVAIGLTGISLLTFFNPLRLLSKLPVDVGNLVVSGTKVTMEHPRMSGFTKDARAYEVIAESAAQDLTNPDYIELQTIHAKVGMQDKSTMEMTAVSGLYNSKTEMLKLQQKIVLTSSTGYKGLLSEATIDIRKGYVLSEHPVELEMLQGVLNANKLEVINSGETIHFDNGVHLTFMMNDQPLVRPKTDGQ
jgi:lipopolysaccharide export system protein LptC